MRSDNTYDAHARMSSDSNTLASRNRAPRHFAPSARTAHPPGSQSSARPAAVHTPGRSGASPRPNLPSSSPAVAQSKSDTYSPDSRPATPQSAHAPIRTPGSIHTPAQCSGSPPYFDETIVLARTSRARGPRARRALGSSPTGCTRAANCSAGESPVLNPQSPPDAESSSTAPRAETPVLRIHPAAPARSPAHVDNGTPLFPATGLPDPTRNAASCMRTTAWHAQAQNLDHASPHSSDAGPPAPSAPDP